MVVREAVWHVTTFSDIYIALPSVEQSPGFTIFEQSFGNSEEERTESVKKVIGRSSDTQHPSLVYIPCCSRS